MDWRGVGKSQDARVNGLTGRFPSFHFTELLNPNRKSMKSIDLVRCG